MGYKVAVIGATGVVGRELVRLLAERGFPVDDIAVLASGRAVGAQLSFGERRVLTVRSLEAFDFAGCDLALVAATAQGSAAQGSAAQATRAAAAGCLVVDTTGQFRMEPDVPLVVPEVNPQALARHTRRRIVASPGSASIALLLALKPLHDRFGVQRVVLSTYQATSEAGKEAMDELFNSTKGFFVNDPHKPEQFTKPIAFNVIPHVGAFLEDGATREEWALAVETRKVLHPDIQVFATCVRVPVFIGTALSVAVVFERSANLGEARDALRNAPGVVVSDAREDGGYITPQESVGEDAVYVSRLRRDPTVPHGLGFWCVTDSQRKGAALNAVQIAEALVEQGLLGAR